MLYDLLEDINSNQPVPEYTTVAELNRQKRANQIYTRYLKEPDRRLERKSLISLWPLSEGQAESQHGLPSIQEG